MMYYNSDKLVLYAQDIIHSMVRPIDVYTLYYRSSSITGLVLWHKTKTLYFKVFCSSFEGGKGNINENKRASMVNTAMTYIRTHSFDGNMLFMGDLNLYKNTEQAYNTLLICIWVSVISMILLIKKVINKSIINSPSNTSLPYEVLQALYLNSDHLPVVARLVVLEQEGGPECSDNIAYIRFANPVQGFLSLQIACLSYI